MKRFIGLLVCTLFLVTPVSASASHSYPNMISKDFISSSDGGAKANRKADNWIDKISPTKLSEYHVTNHQIITEPTYSTSSYNYDDHVTLIKKHESHYQKKQLSLWDRLIRTVKRYG